MVPTPKSCHGEQENVRYPDDSGEALSAFLAQVPAGSVVDVAPGRYDGPVSITRPVTLRGAGELTCIDGRFGRPISIDVDASGPVILDSIRIERGDAEDGGGMLVEAGAVQLRNIHIYGCSAVARGGAIAVTGGTVVAALVRTEGTNAHRGGAVWVGSSAQFKLHNSQLSRCEAVYGGALAFEDRARAEIEGVTVRRARARSVAGGQALYARGGQNGRPELELKRVLIEDGALGQPIVVDPEYPAEVVLQACDMPRAVQGIAGFVDGGANMWR